MQKIRKKQRRTLRHRQLILGVLALLLLGGGLYLAFGPGREDAGEMPERTVTGGMILNREPSEIGRVTLTLCGEEPWTLVREEGELRLQETDPQGESWTVDRSIGDRILDAIANLGYEAVLSEQGGEVQGHLAEFGLENPRVRADILFTDGTGMTLRIGDPVAGAEESVDYMILDGDARLYAVADSTTLDLVIEKNLLHPVEQPDVIASLLDRITVRDGKGEVRAEWRLNGRVTDADAATSWQVTVPFVYPADEEIMGNLRSGAENLRLGTWVGKAGEAGNDLSEITAELELHMAAGSTGTVSGEGVYDVTERPERTVLLRIGPAKSEMVDYVLYEDTVYTMSHFSLSAFLETDPMTTVALYPVLTPLGSLQELTVERDGNTDCYTLEHNGTTGEEGSGLLCRKNGEEIPSEAFEAAYNRLLTVTFSGRLPEDAVWGPAHTKYAFRTVSGGTHTVELSDFDGMHDAVTVDGHTLFYLIRGGMTELP